MCYHCLGTIVRHTPHSSLALFCNFVRFPTLYRTKYRYWHCWLNVFDSALGCCVTEFPTSEALLFRAIVTIFVGNLVVVFSYVICFNAFSRDHGAWLCFAHFIFPRVVFFDNFDSNSVGRQQLVTRLNRTTEVPETLRQAV